MKRIIAWLVLAALVIGMPGAVINTGGTRGRGRRNGPNNGGRR